MNLSALKAKLDPQIICNNLKDGCVNPCRRLAAVAFIHARFDVAFSESTPNPPAGLVHSRL